MKKTFVFLLLILINGCTINAKPEFTAQSVIRSTGTSTRVAVLSRCVDGDTAHFLVNGNLQKVRFLSIDAPEVDHDNASLSQPYGEAASDYTCTTLMSATTIVLEIDPAEDAVDQYGRVLAWIWVDDVLLNAQIVELGYARVKFVSSVNLHSADLEKLQSQAIKADRGIWK